MPQKEKTKTKQKKHIFYVMYVKQQLAPLPASTMDSGQSAFSMAVSRALFVFV